MGDPDNVRITPEYIRGQARKLVEDAGKFGDLVEQSKHGFGNAAADAAPWFSAGGWGMFKKPARAASEAEGFVGQVIGEVELMGDSLNGMVNDLANVDINNGADLDGLGKVVYPQ